MKKKILAAFLALALAGGALPYLGLSYVSAEEQAAPSVGDEDTERASGAAAEQTGEGPDGGERASGAAMMMALAAATGEDLVHVIKHVAEESGEEETEATEFWFDTVAAAVERINDDKTTGQDNVYDIYLEADIEINSDLVLNPKDGVKLDVAVFVNKGVTLTFGENANFSVAEDVNSEEKGWRNAVWFLQPQPGSEIIDRPASLRDGFDRWVEGDGFAIKPGYLYFWNEQHGALQEELVNFQYDGESPEKLNIRVAGNLSGVTSADTAENLFGYRANENFSYNVGFIAGDTENENGDEYFDTITLNITNLQAGDIIYLDHDDVKFIAKYNEWFGEDGTSAGTGWETLCVPAAVRLTYGYKQSEEEDAEWELEETYHDTLAEAIAAAVENGDGYLGYEHESYASLQIMFPVEITEDIVLPYDGFNLSLERFSGVTFAEGGRITAAEGAERASVSFDHPDAAFVDTATDDPADYNFAIGGAGISALPSLGLSYNWNKEDGRWERPAFDFKLEEIEGVLTLSIVPFAKLNVDDGASELQDRMDVWRNGRGVGDNIDAIKTDGGVSYDSGTNTITVKFKADAEPDENGDAPSFKEGDYFSFYTEELFDGAGPQYLYIRHEGQSDGGEYALSYTSGEGARIVVFQRGRNGVYLASTLPDAARHSESGDAIVIMDAEGAGSGSQLCKFPEGVSVTFSDGLTASGDPFIKFENRFGIYFNEACADISGLGAFINDDPGLGKDRQFHHLDGITADTPRPDTYYEWSVKSWMWEEQPIYLWADTDDPYDNDPDSEPSEETGAKGNISYVTLYINTNYFQLPAALTDGMNLVDASHYGNGGTLYMGDIDGNNPLMLFDMQAFDGSYLKLDYANYSEDPDSGFATVKMHIVSSDGENPLDLKRDQDMNLNINYGEWNTYHEGDPITLPANWVTGFLENRLRISSRFELMTGGDPAHRVVSWHSFSDQDSPVNFKLPQWEDFKFLEETVAQLNEAQVIYSGTGYYNPNETVNKNTAAFIVVSTVQVPPLDGNDKVDGDICYGVHDTQESRDNDEPYRRNLQALAAAKDYFVLGSRSLCPNPEHNGLHTSDGVLLNLDDAFTRKDLAYLITKIAKFDVENWGEPTETYTDIGGLDPLYQNAIAICERYGFMNGNGQGLFEPDGAVIQADMLVALKRAIDYGGGLKSGADRLVLPARDSFAPAFAAQYAGLINPGEWGGMQVNNYFTSDEYAAFVEKGQNGRFIPNVAVHDFGHFNWWPSEDGSGDNALGYRPSEAHILEYFYSILAGGRKDGEIFTDVKKSDRFFDGVNVMVNYNAVDYIKGLKGSPESFEDYGEYLNWLDASHDGTFLPNETVTKRQLYLAANQLAYVKYGESGTGFADEALNGANSGDPATREEAALEAAKLFDRGFSGFSVNILDGYSDKDGITGGGDGAYAQAMAYMLYTGRLDGTEDGTLNPQGVLTRAQLAALLGAAAIDVDSSKMYDYDKSLKALAGGN